MAYSTTPKVRRDGQIQLLDHGGSNTLIIAYEEGAFSFDQTKPDRIVIRDRSSIATVRRGDEQPITGSFSFYMRQFTSSTAGSALDFINKTGAYSGNTSSASTGQPFVEEYAIDIKITVDGTGLGDDAADDVHTATFARCVATASFSEGDPNQFNISFECFGGVTYAAA